MKTTMKHIAAGTFIALLLIVANVKAEGTEITASSHEAIETTLQLENWMTDETVWNTNSLDILEFVPETEASLELEDWMTKTELINLNNSFIEEIETGLELEGWMTCDKLWNKNTINDEPELPVESWMINDNLWK